ncbi:hypothetical protein [Thiomicrorhabdus xiamenensis]|uniref:DUF304 domain-containing protein n=1 Tax=Thiomicrorhabdus xiamenensis TaxID=2739063 RepID=A0A7D4NLS6_9GAMM|nr:hypothetical protein [Thiomicrorhabdus xiamenensis]QKI89474.1 hypothetical protein HQN79_07785 [Thiomicrorhabdus xiamenensis]
MELIHGNEIESPVIKVTPPAYAKMFVVAGLLALPLALLLLPIVLWLKVLSLSLYALVLFGIVRNYLKGFFLVTMQANLKGLYIQSDDYNDYYHFPWHSIGVIEKCIFPLNRRGLRIEICGDDRKEVLSSRIGNVERVTGKTFIYTLPQLLNRDRLIADFDKLRKRAAS